MADRGYMPPAVSAEWTTPPDLFAALDAEFHFDLDLAASDENHLCARYFTKERSAFGERWEKRCFCNPPYGRDLIKWVDMANYCANYGFAEVIVMLLPSRTDTLWWHKYVWDTGRCRPWPNVQVRFLRGRLKYGNTGKDGPAPFPSVVVVFSNPNAKER